MIHIVGIPRVHRSRIHAIRGITIALAVSTAVVIGTAAPTVANTIYLAKRYGSTADRAPAPKKRFDPDAPYNQWWGASPSTKSGMGRAVPRSTGYHPNRVKHFWKNFHAPKPEKKGKPIDHEK
jgi:hypothetical protein